LNARDPFPTSTSEALPARNDVTRRVQLVSKFDLAVIVAAIAGGAIWIEQRHHVVIDAPARAELASIAPAAACPDNDNVPYSAGCIVFLGSGYLSGMNWQANAAEGAPARGPTRGSR
jgi:hypothetical protein